MLESKCPLDQSSTSGGQKINASSPLLPGQNLSKASIYVGARVFQRTKATIALISNLLANSCEGAFFSSRLTPLCSTSPTWHTQQLPPSSTLFTQILASGFASGGTQGETKGSFPLGAVKIKYKPETGLENSLHRQPFKAKPNVAYITNRNQIQVVSHKCL